MLTNRAQPKSTTRIVRHPFDGIPDPAPDKVQTAAADPHRALGRRPAADDPPGWQL